MDKELTIKNYILTPAEVAEKAAIQAKHTTAITTLKTQKENKRK